MRFRRTLTVAIGALLLGNAIALAALPSGEKKLADVIPDGQQIVLSRTVGSARVLLLSDGRATSRLRLLVAYKQRDRWHSVHVKPVSGASDAAWAATEGSGPVPAFSAVYGRAPGDKVVVRWTDTKTTEVVPVKGAYLAVRRGRVTSEGVELNPGPVTTTTALPAP
jgi:hypothetical protein